MKVLLLALILLSGPFAFGGPVPLVHGTAPKPTLEQRVAGLEAYIANSDPRESLKSPDGTIAPGLTMSTVDVSGPGHNGWMMTSAALVLFMTLPGLALFYGGLVRRKNVLAILAQCLGIASLVTFLWFLVGYSLVFAAGPAWAHGVIGDLRFALLHNVTSAPNTDYAYWVSHNVFAMYQLMFAIITPALIIGAVAERMRFAAVLTFVGLWMFVVYFPLAHMIWGIDGAMNGLSNSAAPIKAIDFAGGTVVHMSSGWSALILCMMLGRRAGFGKEKMPPHSMVLCMVGTGMLWVGWYGFNAGSALGADGIATNAFMTTTIATAIASGTWAFAEWLHSGKTSVLGFCSGAVGGLVVITPACGFVDATGAFIIGLVAGIVPYFAVVKVKGILGYDDALDTFGVHAVGGTIGAFLTGILATTAANPNLKINLSGIVGRTLWIEQLKAMGITLVMAIVGTLIVGSIVRAIVGLRSSPEAESLGLDLAEHGEEAYIL
jgi:Amt family ammonium transporter